MKKLPLLLVSLIAISSSAYAGSPAERERISRDTTGIHQARKEIRQEIREDKKEIHADKKELRKDKRELRKERRQHRKEHPKK